MLRPVARSGGPELLTEHWPGPEASRKVIMRLAFVDPPPSNSSAQSTPDQLKPSTRLPVYRDHVDADVATTRGAVLLLARRGPPISCATRALGGRRSGWGNARGDANAGVSLRFVAGNIGAAYRDE